MSESLKREVAKLKKSAKMPSVTASKEIKQLLALVAKAHATFGETNWKQEYIKLLNSEWVTKLQDGDEGYLWFACFAIYNWLKPDEKTLDELFELARKINPTVVQKWLDAYDEAQKTN